MATSRVKLAIKNIGNSRTEEEALIKANYSPSYARSGQIKKTKGWQELMEKNLPDHLLTKKHKEGLEAVVKKTVLVDKDESGKPIYDVVNEEDYATRHKYLDTAYKIKGKYPKEHASNNVNVNVITGVEINVRKD